MREYYARFFREFGRQMFIFWKTQIVVSLGAGIIAAATQAIRQSSPMTVGLWSVGFAVIGYLAILGVFAICAVMCTPVRLDQQRVAEIQHKDSEITAKQARITLLEAIPKKHPHDEHIEKTVYETVARLTGEEITFLQWLLDHERAGNTPIQGAGFRGIPQSIVEKTGQFLITFESHRPGNGVVEMDRFYFVNPKIHAALRNVLYPPRPVTPPSA